MRKANRARNGGIVFWDVDTQVDFLTPKGRLYVASAQSIIPNLHLLTAWAADHGIPVISSACVHRPGDPELKIYGPHCMTGTPGQKKLLETLLPSRFTIPNRLIALPELDFFQQIIIDKQEFDVFTNPNTEAILDRFGNSLRIVLYGVATEVCVASAANSLLDRATMSNLSERQPLRLTRRKRRLSLKILFTVAVSWYQSMLTRVCCTQPDGTIALSSGAS